MKRLLLALPVFALMANLGQAAEKPAAKSFAGFPAIGKHRPGQRSVKVITSDAVTGLVRPRWTRAMTDLGGWPILYRFQGTIYLLFPHVDGHRGKKLEATGKLVCLASKDEGNTWAEDTAPPGDTPPEIVVVGDQIYAYECPKGTRVSVSTDHKTWSPSKEVYKPNFCFWGVMHDPISKMFWAPPHHIPSLGSHPDRKIDLVQSKDGVNWDYVSTVAPYNNASESVIKFEEDKTMVVLIRRKYGKNHTIATAKPPYKEWKHEDRPGIVEGEHFFECGGQTFLGARTNYAGDNPDVKANPRIFDGRRSYTIIYRFSKDRTLIPHAVVDSMGDCSYPFMVETPTEILCAYYSQHEDKVCKAFLCGFDKKEFLKGVEK